LRIFSWRLAWSRVSGCNARAWRCNSSGGRDGAGGPFLIHVPSDAQDNVALAPIRNSPSYVWLAAEYARMK